MHIRGSGAVAERAAAACRLHGPFCTTPARVDAPIVAPIECTLFARLVASVCPPLDGCGRCARDGCGSSWSAVSRTGRCAVTRTAPPSTTQEERDCTHTRRGGGAGAATRRAGRGEMHECSRRPE